MAYSQHIFHTSGYVVTKRDACDKCNDFKVCRKTECSFLCPHMYTCSCYDYNNGHVCKHIHRVHYLHFMAHTLQSESPESKGSHYAQKKIEKTESCEHHSSDITITSEGKQTYDCTGNITIAITKCFIKGCTFVFFTIRS